VTKTLAEDQQVDREALAQLRGNKLMQEALAQLQALRLTKRKAQRSALLKFNNDEVVILEAYIAGVEEFFKILDGLQIKLDRMPINQEDAPTVFKY